MSSNGPGRHLGMGALVVAVAGVDRLVKLVVQMLLPYGTVVPVIPGCLNLTHLQNPGAAFGLFAGLPAGVRLPLLVGVSVAALGLLLHLYCQAGWQTPPIRFGLALVAGGALGNLYERILQGAVVDYLDVFMGTYHWPAFNVADAAITVGIGVFLLSTFRPHRGHRTVAANFSR